VIRYTSAPLIIIKFACEARMINGGDERLECGGSITESLQA